MIKNKFLTKDQISEKYKKMRIAAIVGYCLNALLLLLIVLSMVFGSNNASSVSAQNELQPRRAVGDSITYQDVVDNDYVIYEPKYSGNMTFSANDMSSIRILLDIPYVPLNPSVYPLGSTLSLNIHLTNEVFVLMNGYGYDNEFVSFNVVRFSFTSQYESNSMNLYWKLRSVFFAIDGVASTTICRSVSLSADNYEYTFYGYRLVLDSEETFLNNEVLTYFYKKANSNFFSFNSSFNFNAPFGGSLNNKFVTISDTETIHRVTYETGLFISNGRLYDQIKLVYWHASVYLFMTEDGSYELGPSDMYTFKEMYYHPYGASDSATQLVASRDTGNAYISGSWTPYQLQSVTWQNDEFRHILFLQTLSDDLITDINAFNNNTDLSINNYNSGSFLNVFTLVASAITGLMPILNMVILPGVTIGILLFIPLVAMLVFAIIRIIKK